jgi:DNA-binding PadR family transcriptional regulator
MSRERYSGERRLSSRYGELGAGRESYDHGFGRSRERLFETGQLRLVILQLISEKPSYGYQIMKAIEERLSGSYAPSPGVVYPTLTLLAREGLAAVSSTDSNRKRYAATEEGRKYLNSNRVVLEAIFRRMEHAREAFQGSLSPQLIRAIVNLRVALEMRVGRGILSAEQMSRVAKAIDAAARAVDET